MRSLNKKEKLRRETEEANQQEVCQRKETQSGSLIRFLSGSEKEHEAIYLFIHVFLPPFKHNLLSKYQPPALADRYQGGVSLFHSFILALHFYFTAELHYRTLIFFFLQCTVPLE